MANTLALVGSESLMGREVRDIVAVAGLPWEVKLIAADDAEAGTLTEQSGEAAVVTGLTAENLEEAGVVVLAGSPESSRQAMELAPDAVFIDLTHSAEERADARVRAPMVEPDAYDVPDGAVQVVAHPAAIAMALFLERLHSVHRVHRAVMNVFEPASERGTPGVDELHQQTLSLFAFKGMPKKIYDEQLSFNMLPAYGEEAPVALADVEARIERHLATLLSFSEDAPPMPSIRLIQVPVFHGHTISAWVELESNPGAAEVEQALAGDFVDLREAGTTPPNIVGVAGEGGIAVGAVAVDRNNPEACRFWIVADNLRLAGKTRSPWRASFYEGGHCPARARWPGGLRLPRGGQGGSAAQEHQDHRGPGVR